MDGRQRIGGAGRIGNRLVAATLAVVAVAARAEPPDIVVFLADDLSVTDCGPYHAASGIRTPNIDRLAAEGMTFTHAFVASPSCAPSRASLLTGLSPPRHGAMFNHSVPDDEAKPWPAYFRELGYETAAIGKVAHYHTGERYRFDVLSHGGTRDEACVRFAADWLARRGPGKPLCLLVGTHWPHTPWPKGGGPREGVFLPPNQLDTPQTRLARSRYAEAVERADHDLGIVLDAARRHLGADTLFLFSSDHGSAFPFGKWNVYDDGIRTPLIVAWPGQVAAGSRSDALVSWVDLLPTCIEAAGGQPPASGSEPGELSGSTTPISTRPAAARTTKAFGSRGRRGRRSTTMPPASWNGITTVRPRSSTTCGPIPGSSRTSRPIRPRPSDWRRSVACLTRRCGRKATRGSQPRPPATRGSGSGLRAHRGRGIPVECLARSAWTAATRRGHRADGWADDARLSPALRGRLAGRAGHLAFVFTVSV